MASVNFGSFVKRKNSTKVPTVELTDSRTVTLKESCSQDNPVFICTGNNFNYNYCQWDGKYYFINDIVSLRNNLIEIHCEIDVLATYKASIQATTAYVMYDSTSNSEIPDNRLPMKTSASVGVKTVTCPFVPDGGCYILSLTGAHGTTGVYKTDASGLASLIDDVSDISDDLFDMPVAPTPPTPPTTSTIETEIQFAADMIKYFVDCIKWILTVLTYPISQFFGSGDIPQNIRECRFIPFNVGTTLGLQDIYLGTFKTGQQLGKLNTDTVHRTVSVDIPWPTEVVNNQTVTISDYRRRSPYTELYLYLPYIGMTRLSAENLMGQSSISVAYTLCLRDGSLICTVSSGGEIIGQYSGNVAASVPVGLSNISLQKAAQAIGIGAAAAAAQNLPAIGMGAISFAEALTPNFSCIGGLDGIATIATNQNITCYSVFHDTIERPNTNLQEVGSPTMKPRSLSGLTGYCQCVGAHVAADATGSELDTIDNFLNSGFYIE